MTLTKVTSPPSLRPADGPVRYKVISGNDRSRGQDIEAQYVGPTVVNKIAGVIQTNSADATPSYFEKGAPANYTISFVPVNFERNMRIIILFPKQIKFSDDW